MRAKKENSAAALWSASSSHRSRSPVSTGCTPLSAIIKRGVKRRVGVGWMGVRISCGNSVAFLESPIQAQQRMPAELASAAITTEVSSTWGHHPITPPHLIPTHKYSTIPRRKKGRITSGFLHLHQGLPPSSQSNPTPITFTSHPLSSASPHPNPSPNTTLIDTLTHHIKEDETYSHGYSRGYPTGTWVESTMEPAVVSCLATRGRGP